MTTGPTRGCGWPDLLNILRGERLVPSPSLLQGSSSEDAPAELYSAVTRPDLCESQRRSGIPTRSSSSSSSPAHPLSLSCLMGGDQLPPVAPVQGRLGAGGCVGRAAAASGASPQAPLGPGASPQDGSRAASGERGPRRGPAATLSEPGFPPAVSPQPPSCGESSSSQAKG